MWTVVDGRACCGRRSISVTRLAVGHQLHLSAVGIVDEQAAVALVPRHAETIEVRCGVVERALAVELEREMVEAGLAPLRQARAVRLVVAGKQRPAACRARARRARTGGPTRRRLVEVGDAEADVVETMQADHGIAPSATIRSASSSGMARATCSVLPDISSCSPGPSGRRPTPRPCSSVGRARRSRPRRRRPAPSAASSQACRSGRRRQARA